MNKPLLIALSALFFGLKLATPLPAHCGSCEADKAAQTVQCDASTKAKCDASTQKSLEDRIACLEQCLKDACSCDSAGSPFSSKSQGSKASVCPKSQKSCPMSQCPADKCGKAKKCPKAKAESSDAS